MNIVNITPIPAPSADRPRVNRIEGQDVVSQLISLYARIELRRRQQALALSGSQASMLPGAESGKVA